MSLFERGEVEQVFGLVYGTSCAKTET